MANFLENWNQRLAEDPYLQQALLQFGARATQPYDERTASPISQILGAMQGSVEYLQQLRDAELQRKAKERQLQVQEGQLNVARQGAATAERRAATEEEVAATGKRRAATEEYSVTQGEVPAKQAYARYLDAQTKMERLRLKMEKMTGKGAEFDKDLFAAAGTLTGDAMGFDDPKQYQVELYKNYNRLAAAYGKPVMPIPLEFIKDEDLLRSITTPEAEALFGRYYGQPGMQRLSAARKGAQPVAPTPAAKPVKPSPLKAEPGLQPEVPSMKEELKPLGKALKKTFLEEKKYYADTDEGEKQLLPGEKIKLGGKTYTVGQRYGANVWKVVDESGKVRMYRANRTEGAE